MSIAFVVIAAVLIALGGFTMALRASLATLSRNDLLEEAEKVRKPQALHKIASDIEAHITALRFVRVFLETIAAALITLALVIWLPEWWQVLLAATGIMTAVSFVVVGSSPRSVGVRNARFLVRFFARFVRLVRIALGPLAEALIVVGNIVTPGSAAKAGITSEDQFRHWVDEAADQDMLEEEDRELLHSVFEFGDTIVREVMVARTGMITLDADDTVHDAMAVFLDKGVSRIPVIGKNSDEVIGICYLRDVARVQHEKPALAKKSPISSLAKPPLFVPESKKADDALRFLQREQNHLAMVVDEYGGIAGLVTMEDLMEELVGEISDEYDEEVVDIHDLGSNTYRVSAKYAVADLADLYDIDIEEDDVDTVGGLLTKYVGRLPVLGSRAETDDLILVAEKLEGRPKRVAWIHVSPTGAWLERTALRAEIDQAITGEINLP
ncbi:MAG: hemolysin family protein [Pontimonas sp.]|nr:hemolysin family protein [Pontimonas sp.]